MKVQDTRRGASPVLFSYSEQRSSAAASDLVSFGGSECEAMDDSISLAAFDAEKLSGSSHDPVPLPSSEPSVASTGMDAELFRNKLFKVLDQMAAGDPDILLQALKVARGRNQPSRKSLSAADAGSR
ncbi:hypothetical protein Q8A67_003539 [Cirrhinus molitorella]|uniref:Uncharacterized protein n=1 Tax=Cirrhinus molitorella TaxID=172907 RepID=A0AA88QFC6_9TELE|nr:hypothetical protein Q8A67_003539 [Cirrhinus molitorella]